MSGNVFINYRRGDDPGFTGRLFDRLQHEFHSEQLFIDVDSIAPGLDFVNVLEEQVAKCDVMLVVIGKNWTEACDETGQRRLDSSEDYVRLEVEAALKLDKRVIPVLVHNTRMPRSDELPSSIRSLARRNAIRLTHERFRADTEGLIRAVRVILNEMEAHGLGPQEPETHTKSTDEEALPKTHGQASNRSTYNRREKQQEASTILTGKSKTNIDLKYVTFISFALASILLFTLQLLGVKDIFTDNSDVATGSSKPFSSTFSEPSILSLNSKVREQYVPDMTLSKVAPNGAALTALVIGNAEYPHDDRSLVQPVSDARLLSQELRRIGFDVIEKENLTKQKFEATIQAFVAKIKPGSAALLFFSGYGIQANHRTYLIPVDAQIWTEGEVMRDGIRVESVLADMDAAGAAVKVVIIDAARRNPFERRFRGTSIGLAPLDMPRGTLAIYSASPNKVIGATNAKNSMFVAELLKQLRTPGLKADEVLNNTQKGVLLASKGEQVPWISSTLMHDFIVVRDPAPRSRAAPKP